MGANETLFMDISSTVLELVRLLPEEMPVTVVTNSVAVLTERAHKHIRGVCIGGQLRPDILTLVAPWPNAT